MKFLFFFVALNFGFGVPAQGADPAWIKNFELPAPEIETLSNGLEIVWFVDQSLPVVDLGIMIRSGYRDDPIGFSGTAQLLAQSLDKGAGGWTARELSLAIERLGASRTVGSDEDTFSVFVHGLSTDVATLLEILSKMTLQPTLDSKEIDKESKKIQEGWQRVGDYAQSLSGLAFSRIMTHGTSYGRGGVYSLKEFKRVGPKQVREFYREHFAPSNAVLLVVGKVEKNRFRKEILKHFGGWSGPEIRREYVEQSPKLWKMEKGELGVIVDRPGLSQAQVIMGFRAPPYLSPDHYALEVGNALLGDFFYSRLNAVIRDQLGLTYGIDSSFNYSKELAVFSITSSTRNEAVGKLILETRKILVQTSTEAISDKEVETAKNYLIGSFPLQMSTLSSVASRWLGGYVFGFGQGYLNEYIPKISAVTARQVSAAFARHMKAENLVIILAGDAHMIQKSLKEARLPSLRVVSIQQLRDG